MYKFFTCIFALFFFIACKNNGNSKNQTTDSSTENRVQRDNVVIPGINTNFYKRFDGKLAGQDVVAHMAKFEDKIFFTYYYVSKGMPIGLYAYNEVKLPGDSVEFLEYNRYNRTYTDKQDDKWHVAITENDIKGKWISGDGKTVHDISLKENYPAGSYLFNITGIADSVKIPVRKDTSTAKSFMMLMEPSDAAVGSWFKNTLIKTFSGKEAFSGTISQMLEDQTKEYLSSYKAEIDTMLMNNEITDDGRIYSLNYENSLDANAIYNDNGYLVMNVGSYMYTGGAHGLEGESVICYDMAGKKQMQLNDVISVDSTALQKIVEKNFRLHSGIKPGQPLTEILFENKLQANDNFYFTNKGLGFIYQPYEVAAYAMGIIYVFIPYEEVKPFINPAFAKRMGIQ